MLNATLFRSKLPENCYNADRDGVTVDFSMKFTKHDFVVRPLYWQTIHTLSFGLFYLDDNGQPVHLPVYEMEKTDTYDENSVLGWAPAPVRSITVEDYMNDPVFRQFMLDEGIEFATLDDRWIAGKKAEVPVLSATDNFFGPCTSLDDRKMTRACRAYLESIGYANSQDAPEDQRYNYVYRWEMTGPEALSISYPNPDYTDINLTLTYKKDLEITFTYYACDTGEAKAFGTDNDMLKGVGAIQNGRYKAYDQLDWPALICKGIKVHLDDIDRTYGAYIQNDNGDKYYSMSSLNPEKRWIPKPGAERTLKVDDSQSGTIVHKYDEGSDFMIDSERHAYRAATWRGTKYGWRYMCFEDGTIPPDTYNPGSCDFDMQDFVFIVDDFPPGSENPPIIIQDNDNPEDPDGTPVTWTLAVEDLGETDDYDFNDLVLSVEYVSGQPTATVKALAAGGVYPIYVKYRDKLIDARHVNAWLGENDPTKMINTYSIDHEHKDGITLTLDPADKSINDIFKHLTILVYADDEAKGGEKVIEITHHRDDEIHPDNCGKAPLMILVEDKWKWPVERIDITDAYPRFKEWVGNRNITDWWKEDSYTVPRE